MHPDPIHDPRCLVTSEALFVDGANGVCHDPRVGDPSPWRAVGLVVATALVIAWLSRARLPSRRRAAWLLALALGAALPGWLALLVVRADGPMQISASAAETRRLHDTLRDFAREHGCAEVRLDHCLTCAPIARLALSGLTCDHPASIELHEDAASGACAVEDDTLICGSAAR